MSFPRQLLYFLFDRTLGKRDKEENSTGTQERKCFLIENFAIEYEIFIQR